MDAMGKDIIFVEAVGSGQGEVDIARVADTSVMVLTPGMGDEVQMMKAGIFETADVFVINKADREGADNLKTSLELMLNMKTYAPGEWQPCIVLTEAIHNTGTEQLANEIYRHRDFLTSSGRLEKRRKERAELELSWAVESYIRKYIEEVDKDYLAKLVDDLVHRKTSPHSAAAKIVNLSRKAEKGS
jgi:LAO/AO transport system kinase